MIELSQSFTFEAAHFLPSAPDGHHNRRIHGHSFTVDIVVSGQADADTGILIHFETLAELCKTHLHSKLDHQFLNDIQGLEIPTLENLCLWIANTIRPYLPILKEVIIYRPSCGQKCRYIVT
jgi:6-pyruvoyltetrahydropterin/6-carboxytetrahydropterin synthase